MAGAISLLADSAREIQRQLALDYGEPLVLHILEGVGGHVAGASRVAVVVDNTGAHLGEVTMQLTPGEGRALTTDEVAARWREQAARSRMRSN